MLTKAAKRDLDRFGRLIALLLNRSMMYEVNHPYVTRALDEFHLLLSKILQTIQPLVFAMNRDQFFVDDEPLDSQINTNRILAHFKKIGMESISFDPEISKNEIRKSLEILFSLDKYPDAPAMKRALVDQRVLKLKINHVVFRKVTEHDEVVSREELRNWTPEKREQVRERSKRVFMDMVMEGLLAEELGQTLDLKRLLEDPGALSRGMVEADLQGSSNRGEGNRETGLLLLQQLRMVGQGINEGLSGGQETGLADLAVAVFEMKRELMEQVAARKAEEITYPNEGEILDEAHQITDMVLMRLLREEYMGGKVSVQRLAQIIRRLIPDVNELGRELPKIKETLQEAGMPSFEFLQLVQELERELEGEGLGKVLQMGSEAVGVQAKELIEELKRDPGQAAALICLAAEMRKATGDEGLLTDLLVNYVEGRGANLANNGKETGMDGGQRVRDVIRKLETSILWRLKEMDVRGDVLLRLEEKLDARLDLLFERWRQLEGAESAAPEKIDSKERSVMEILEESIEKGNEFGEILGAVRSRMEHEKIDENDFGRIYEEIAKVKRSKRAPGKSKMPPGVLRKHALKYLIRKEILRATRYGLPFSTVAFSVVHVRETNGQSMGEVKQQKLQNALLRRLSTLFRDVDIIGELGENQLVALLPVTTQEDARIALRRSLKALHAEPVKLNGDSWYVKVAGIAMGFNGDQTPDLNTFLVDLSDQLGHMTARVKNIQGFF